MPYFHRRENMVRTLFERSGGRFFSGVRLFADGRVEVDHKAGFDAPLQTCKGCIVGGPLGKVTVRLRGKQLTATVIGGSPD